MKNDIHVPEVKHVTVAIVEKKEGEWEVILLNKNKVELKNVLVASKGYGRKDGEEIKTSTLRHFVGDVAGDSHALIEPIQPELFALTNEFWVTYYIENKIFDKKFIFPKGSIQKSYLTFNESLNAKAILHA